MLTSLLIYVAVGFGGGILHWLKKWAEGSTQDTLKQYLTSNARSTLSSAISILTASGGAFLASPEVSAASAIYLFLACLGLDAALNKSSEYDPETKTYGPRLPAKIARGADPKDTRKLLNEIAERIKHEDIQDLLDRSDRRGS
jgi:hypothetical protein